MGLPKFETGVLILHRDVMASWENNKVVLEDVRQEEVECIFLVDDSLQ
jgi:hypothetical protein